MKRYAKEIAARIIELREKMGLLDYKALAGRLHQNTSDPAGKATSRETVRLWEVGKVIPPYDKIEQLARLFGEPEEYILFGIRRGEQLKQERRYLAYVTDEEAAMLSDFRRANPTGQKQITDHAVKMAQDFPAPPADVRLIRRKK